MGSYLWFGIAATASRLLPLAIGGWRWRALHRGGRWLVLFVAIALAGDLCQLALSFLLGRNNLWIGHAMILLATPVALLAFAAWSGGALRRGFRTAAAASVAGWAVLTLVLESPTRFARTTGPVQAVLLSVAAIGLLLARGVSGEGRLFRRDWFWAALGVLLPYSLAAVRQPLLDLVTSGQVTGIPVWTVLKAFAVLAVVANLCFARALALSEGGPAPAARG